MPDLQTALGTAYTLERELGRGGMATVYLARDTKHSRQVALKVLHADLAASLGPERFRREIGFAATLQHPHILTVLDSGETSAGHLWFTMPYVEGESLRDRLRRETQLAIGEATRITHEIAMALDFAHKRGVVHRDVKPENILITSDGQALLADFGIARALEPSGASTTLTATGTVVGTVSYMSPEQASGEHAVGGASDVYSLGAVTYEMLAGEPPFTGATSLAVIAKMMSSEAPSVRRVRAAVPETMDAAVRRALAPVPADRWPTAGEFAKALETSASGLTQSPSPSRARIPVAALALALGFLIGAGVLFAWRMKGGTTAAGPIRLAVLPFDNLGDSADAYFADGVTDDIRDKLTSLAGLEVVGSNSSGQYRHSSKPPRQVAQELGVRYLLVGRVRWAKSAGGTNRVQVSPELVDASTLADRWAAPFDAPLTDVFQVQIDIAEQVAEALKLTLTPATQQTLAEKPTNDIVAYEAYLRALDLEVKGASTSVVRREIPEYLVAVTRDSSFALAWAHLGVAEAILYTYTIPSATLADSADKATARALALAPNLPEARIARSRYYNLVAHDIDRSKAQIDSGLALSPTNAPLLRSAAAIEGAKGHWSEAMVHAEESAALEPRDVTAQTLLCDMALSTRDTSVATRACGRGLALAPENLVLVEFNAMCALARGDLAGARRVMHAVPATVDQSTLAAQFAEFLDLGWVLDSAQQARLLSLRPDAFDNDTGTWALTRAEVYAWRGDLVHARVYADSGVRPFREQVARTPTDDQRHLFLGMTLAYLGEATEAVTEAERGAELLPVTRDAHDGVYDQWVLARVYLTVGQPDKALDLLEQIIANPFYVTRAWLRIDPTWTSLHGNPRFERLTAAH